MHDESVPFKRPRSAALERRSLKRFPQKLAGTYLVAALLIALPQFWLNTVVPSAPPALPHLQSSEALLFAGITAWMLYWFSRRSLRTLQQTEVQLRESEERLRMVTETIQEVFWLCSADKSQIFYVSPAYEQIWGRSCDSLYQNPRSVLDTIHPDDREHVAVNLAHPNDAPHQYEYRIIKPDGAVRWIANRSFPIRNAAEQIYRTAGVSRDITEHKEIEIALRENEAFFKLALDFTHIGSWDWRIPTNQVIWNENHARLLGLVPGEVQASYQAWRDRVHPDDIDRVERAVIHALETKTNFEAEYRVVYPDGSVHWLIGRGRGLYNPSGQVIRMIGAVLDFTERKQAEAHIQRLNQTLEQQNLELEALVEQSNAELMTVINTLPDRIFVIERDTMRMRFCNDANARLIGWESRHQVAGKTVFECFTPALAATFSDQNQQVFASGETLHFQECYTTPLGTWHFDTYKIPLQKPDGEVYALVGSSRDISELVKARQELDARTTQLEIANRELESFSYSVSHDLRAPLRQINGFVAALTDRLQQSDRPIDPTVTHYLQVIQASSHKMGKLIDGLLALSRVGRQQMADTLIDLNQLVTSVLAQRLDSLMPMHPTGIVSSTQRIECTVSALPTVRGDVTLLRQVFVNLLDNAIKFSRQQAVIQIEVGALPDSVIYVRDRGVGFQMAYADQLFGAFQRLHPQSEFEGSGIGLAIVQRIIHRHDGKIWAESQPGQGATFYFTLGRTLGQTRID